jgi:hypothetical protein
MTLCPHARRVSAKQDGGEGVRRFGVSSRPHRSGRVKKLIDKQRKKVKKPSKTFRLRPRLFGLM